MIWNGLLMLVMLLAVGVMTGCQGSPQQQVLSPVYSGEIATFDESVPPIGSLSVGPPSGGSIKPAGHGQNHSH